MRNYNTWTKTTRSAPCLFQVVLDWASLPINSSKLDTFLMEITRSLQEAPKFPWLPNSVSKSKVSTTTRLSYQALKSTKSLHPKRVGLSSANPTCTKYIPYKYRFLKQTACRIGPPKSVRRGIPLRMQALPTSRSRGTASSAQRPSRSRPLWPPAEVLPAPKPGKGLF